MVKMPDGHKVDMPEHIDLDRVGTGGHFEQGSYKTARHKGLAGELRRLKWAGSTVRATAKNLSRKDLEVIEHIIGDELKRLPANETKISFFSKRRMKRAGYIAKREGKLSPADHKDFKRLVNSLGGEHVQDLHEIAETRRSQSTPSTTQNVQLQSSMVVPHAEAERIAIGHDTTMYTEESATSPNHTASLPSLAAQLPRHRQKEPPAMDIG